MATTPHEPGIWEPVFHTGFNAHVGPVFRRNDSGEAAHHFVFEAREHHLNSGGVVHGGMLMALSDIILGKTVSLTVGGVPCSTMSLDCNFVAPGHVGDRIEGHTAITRRTKSVVFVSGRLAVTRPGESETLLMTASGVWKILNAGQGGAR